jgi:hypothetical protein
MALRILPFRQYSDHDVVNLYSLANASILSSTTGTGAGDAGVFVKVSAGNFSADPIDYQTNTYLGDTSYPYLGNTTMYPEVNLEVTPSTSGEVPLGMTLYQTAENDENGEKLLYHPTKQTELQAMLPGQAVPVATKGIFTLATAAFDAPTPSVGDALIASHTTAGKVSGVSRGSAGNTGDIKFGHVIGTGSRSTVGNATDQFVGDYIVVSFNCNI